MPKRALILLLVLALLLAVVPLLVQAQTAGGACPGAPLPRLVVGGQGRVAQVFSSLRADLDSDVILTVMYRANNDTFKVLAGPECGTGPHNWWRVEFKGQVGWVTEGVGDTYWVEPVAGAPAPTSTGTITATPVRPTATAVPATATGPTATPPRITATPAPVTGTSAPHTGACPGAPAPRLTIGRLAQVAQVFSSLRAGLDSNVVLAVMYRANNDTFRIITGPFCGTGPHNWWQVEFKGQTGWITEGQGSSYWVEPVPLP